MIKAEDIEKAYVGKAVPCPVKITGPDGQDVTLDFNLKPYNGDYLIEILSVREAYMKALEKAKGNTAKASLLCDESVFKKFRDLLAEWLATDIQGDDPKKTALDLLTNQAAMKQVAEYFEKIHGFDKKTDKEMLSEEVSQIKERIQEEKKNARKPRRNRNNSGGSA